MNEAKLWQLRAGLITEGEYQDSMEEALPFGSPHGKSSSTFDAQKEPKMFTPDGEVGTEFKPATTAQAFIAHLLDIIKELRDNKNDVRKNLQTAELVQLDTLLNKMLTAAKDPANKAVDIKAIGNFAASKFNK